MAKVGAVYCVYDACPLLEESVARIYTLVDKVVFLINFKPWCGNNVAGAPEKTFQSIMSFPDPEGKFEIVSQSWDDEKDQRNAGLLVLRSHGIDWCLIIDDDEFYNHDQLKSVFDTLDTAVHAAYLFYHQIYWKSQNTVIEGLFGAFPSLIRTSGIVNFNENRMILVNSGNTWFNIAAEDILCHHLSYVRSDDDMQRKVEIFSHGDDLTDNWFNRVWMHWHEEMTDLHPTTPTAFRRAVPVAESSYKLTAI